MKKLFLFTRGERNGTIVLLILLLIMLCIRLVMPMYYKQKEIQETKKFEKQRIALMTMLADLKPEPVKDSLKNVRYLIAHSSRPFKGFKETIPKMEINRSDTGDLVKLPGVGEVIAQRIIKYRDLLGGFYSKMQLQEVYGITHEIFGKFSSGIFVDTSLIIKLDINNDAFKKINAHPYISYNQSKAIFKLRNNKGGKIKAEDLREDGIFDSMEIEKIKPYLKFD